MSGSPSERFWKMHRTCYPIRHKLNTPNFLCPISGHRPDVANHSPVNGDTHASSIAYQHKCASVDLRREGETAPAIHDAYKHSSRRSETAAPRVRRFVLGTS